MRTARDSPPLALALLLALSAALLGALAFAASTPRAGHRTAPAALLPDLNTAPERHLILLPGIGPARARAIVEERTRGPFETIGDLSRVRGIGPATTAALASLVSAPSRPPARVREGDP
ncbi:MAG: helix-hairpin-helix domain-containing protein [Planctomycetes bacterium]|nr:helix-hairpin-helix domain-containing protein [Planctomycetota bacterium]